MRKTKIICTLGPSTDKGDVMETLVREGMDVARFNFSHGTHPEQKERLDKLKEIRERQGKYVAALLDTKGPEIRIRTFADGKIELEEGQVFTLTPDDVEGTQERVSVTYEDLYKDVKPGDSVLIDDGLIGLEVVSIDGKDVNCIVKNGGMVSNRKGINLPGNDVSMPFISEKDREDILFGIQEGFDFIAASFTRTADDVEEIRKLLRENGGEQINIIAKIENQQGVNNIDSIIEAADGIMVARGDMGVEIPFEKIPSIQKRIITKAYRAGKQVITATQMLESMITNPRPTRAEITDVANAIYDGTSAIMLSGETAAGAHPVEVVRTMALIAETTEEQIDYVTQFKVFAKDTDKDITSAISHATVTTAHDLGAKAIITVTKSGSTARMISKHRPQAMIVGCTTSETVCRQMSMSWGVVPLMCDEKKNTDELFSHAVDVAKQNNLVHKGDTVVITAGIPLGISGTTNMLKVEKL